MSLLSITPFLSGFALGGSLIIAIGSQNAFILRMGLMRQHVFWLCLFCAVSDTILILAGVFGLGAFVDASPSLFNIIAVAGALFLFIYAALALRRVFDPTAMQAAQAQKHSLLSALTICATFTWLNPHVYLDTIVLVGGYASKFPIVERWGFAIGAALASFGWFFGLGYGSKYLAKYLKSTKSWQILDLMIAAIMLLLGVTLLSSIL